MKHVVLAKVEHLKMSVRRGCVSEKYNICDSVLLKFAKCEKKWQKRFKINPLDVALRHAPFTKKKKKGVIW